VAKPMRRMTIVGSWDEVPSFSSQAEEAAFWATHELSEELLAKMGPLGEPVLPPPRPRTKPIAIRFDESTIHRIKALAYRRGKGYQTLLKEFVTERLYEEEKREGVIGRDDTGSSRPSKEKVGNARQGLR
jgi:hypothetical protein